VQLSPSLQLVVGGAFEYWQVLSTHEATLQLCCAQSGALLHWQLRDVVLSPVQSAWSGQSQLQVLACTLLEHEPQAEQAHAFAHSHWPQSVAQL